MGGIMEVATPILSGVGTGAKIIEAERTKGKIKDARREQTAGLDDLSMRREATYRNSRMALQGAIEDFYQQKGWKIPERLPGAFTTRGLPGEAPLYPKGEQSKLPEISSEDDASQIASSIDGGTPSDVGRVDVSPVRRPTTGNMLDTTGMVPQASTSIPVAPIARAPIIGNPIAAVPPVEVKKDEFAPIYIPNRSYGINKILPLLSR